MLKNPYIYICEDAIRSKTITDVNKFIAKQVGTKYVHSRYPKIGFPQIRRILVDIHAILCLTQWRTVLRTFGDIHTDKV